MDNKLSELKAAADKYSLTLNAHRENPRDIDAIRAWDEADTQLSRITSHDETNIIIALLAELEEVTRQRDNAQSSRDLHAKVNTGLNERLIAAEQRAAVDHEAACNLVVELSAAKERIAELESDLSEWTDCKHDGATWYDFSGRERCGKCGSDV